MLLINHVVLASLCALEDTFAYNTSMLVVDKIS